MKTDELIQELVREGAPVKPLASPLVRFSRWFLASFFCLATGVVVYGLRTDLETAVQSPAFYLQILFLLALASLSAFSAFILSIPDYKKPGFDSVPLVTLFLWVSVIVFSGLRSERFATGMGFSCAREIFVLGFLPGLLLFIMIRQAAPLQLGKVGAFCALSVAGLGALGTQFICSNDNALHVLLWHYIPVLMLGGFGVLLGRVFFKWRLAHQ